MRRFLSVTLPVVAVCMLASNVALAQGQGGRGGRGGGFGGFGGGMGGGGVGFLLGNEQVQKELKMSEDQVSKVRDIGREAFAGFGGGGGQRGADLSEEERTKRREEMAKRAEETNKKYLAVLDADQTTRVKQIQLWVSGAAGVASNEEAAKELKLTDDQKAALKAINEEAGKKRMELFGAGGGGRGASDEERTKRREQMASLQKDTEAECQAVLTDEQKSQFAKMRGPKFELDMTAFGRGGPGGGRGRRGGNNNN